MVSDQFWMIYGIAEYPQPTDKSAKYTPRHLGAKSDTDNIVRKCQGTVVKYPYVFYWYCVRNLEITRPL